MLQFNRGFQRDRDTPPMQASRMKYTVFAFLLMASPLSVLAEWGVMNLIDADTNEKTTIAYTKNAAGYTLEIYQDREGVIHSRFTINGGFNMLSQNTCPTFQVDKHKPTNLSINDELCVPDKKSADFILGYVENNKVVSRPLHYVMVGKSIVYRFNLENGGYGETEFSLQGSMRALIGTLGLEIEVVPTDR